MTWFPDMATPAFCETVQLRKMILERQQLPRFSPRRVLEPASAEFIAALAAGSNSRNILQIGCGLSTIALAAAARATGTCLVSVHTDKEKQEIVHHHIKYLGLVDYVEFIVDEPTNVIPQREGVDFVFFTGDPDVYISHFDLLKLKHEAIVIADNALHESTNDYIKHVRRQPGVDSSTLPLGRGIEVTKIVNWDKFKSGRMLYTGSFSKDAGGADVTNELKSTTSDSSSSLGGFARILQSSVAGQNLSNEKTGVGHNESCDANYTGEDQATPLSTVHTSSAKLRECGSGLELCLNTNETSVELIPAITPPSNPEDCQYQPGLELVLNMTDTSVEPHELNCGKQGPSSLTMVGSCAKTLGSYPGISESSELLILQSTTSPDMGEESMINTDSSIDETSLADGTVDTREREIEARQPLLLEGETVHPRQQEIDKNPSHLLECVVSDEQHFPETLGSADLASTSFKIQFRNHSLQTEVRIKGIDQDMLLTDISMAFHETGVSVRRAKISTQDKYIEDVFYVVDGETRSPLHPSRWDGIKEKVLQKIVERRQHAKTLDALLC